jgi:hypothetical protein
MTAIAAGEVAFAPPDLGSAPDVAAWPLPVGRVERRGPLTLVHSRLQGGFSVAEYKLIREPGRRVELVDGVAVVGPVPPPSHRRAVLAVYLAVDAACPDGCCAFVGPLDVVAGPAAVYAADLVVWPERDPDPGPDADADADGDGDGDGGNVGPPVLVVDVLGDGGDRDPRERAAGYRAAGAGWYWAVDPDAARVTVADLAGDGGVRTMPGLPCAVEGPFPAAVDLSGVPGLR